MMTKFGDKFYSTYPCTTIAPFIVLHLVGNPLNCFKLENWVVLWHMEHNKWNGVVHGHVLYNFPKFGPVYWHLLLLQPPTQLCDSCTCPLGWMFRQQKESLEKFGGKFQLNGGYHDRIFHHWSSRYLAKST